MLVAVAVGGSFMILGQTETFASANYKQMTQARYAAESGVHKTINYLLNSYTQPGAVSDPMSAYTTTGWPVTYGGSAVVLSANSSVSSNYPVSATQTAFNTAGQGTLTLDGTTVSYQTSAKLLSMLSTYTYGMTTPQIAQIWLITGDGSTSGTRPATVEVTATLETQVTPYSMYGLFATNPGCGALSFSSVTTDSYDSSAITLSGGVPVTDNYGGNVGTNGNLTEGGGSVVNGSLSTPRTGVGNCKSGAIDALTQNGNKTQVTGGEVQLPQAVTYTTPSLPSPLPATGNLNVTSASACSSITGLSAVCATSTGGFTFTPAGGTVSVADLKLTSGTVAHFGAGTYNLNSISLQGNSQVIIDSGPVIFNVVGTGQTNPVDFSGGSVSNSTFIPSNFQIIYAGTNGVQISGGASTSLMAFAPNAAMSLTGGSGIYGALIAATISDQGGTKVHYDRHSPHYFGVLSNSMLSAFSWTKY
jgi:hypothetical protein